jgi:Rrf2 family nitric oxide-sensitive transcriptional repressor
MHITQYTDYALRVLIYVAHQPNRLVTIQEIADGYQISKNHLMKVVNDLNRRGYLETVRGKNGGLRLHRDPSQINIGKLFRETEQDLVLVECFGQKNCCVITPVCELKSIFREALQAFLHHLDQYTLADTVRAEKADQLLNLLHLEPAPGHSRS